MSLIDELRDKFGCYAVHRMMAKRLKKGWQLDQMCRAFGLSRQSVRAFAKRNGIRFGAIQTKDTFIYVLKDPVSLEVRWVGRSNNPKARLSGHLTSPTNGFMKTWIELLKEDGLKPLVEIVARVRFKFCQRAELALIRKYAKTCRLFNIDGNA